MRVLCLLALIGATFSGCCSPHRSWTKGFSACVSQGDGCQAPRQKSSLFRKKNSCSRCSHCYDSCSGGCATEMEYLGATPGGCSSCAQGGMVYGDSQYSDYSTEGAMPNAGTCPTCHQSHMIPQEFAPAPMQQSTPIAPTPPAAPLPPEQPMPPAEPHQARMQQSMPMQPVRMSPQPMQPLLMLPQQAQPVQFQEWQPHQPHQPQPLQQPLQQPLSLVPYNPPAQPVPQQAQSAVQPVLWVPAAPQAPLLMPAR